MKGCYLLLLLWFSISCANQNTHPKKTKPATVRTSSTPMVQDTITVVRSPLYVSRDFGTSWEEAHANLPMDTEVSFLERIGNELVLATDNKGIFRSVDNRKSWEQIGDGLPGRKINALHIAEAENRIWISVYREGIFEWHDQNKRWINLSYQLSDKRVQSILKIGERLFIGTDTGIFKLEKEQKKWIPLFENVQVLSLEYLQGRIIAGTHRGSLLSEDEGANWRWIHEEGAVHYTHLIDDTIFEMCISGELYFSTDFGTNWSKASYGPRSGSYVYEVVAIGDYLLLSNNYGIHRSVDNGLHWQHIYPTEAMGFFDFIVVNGLLYGGTRGWDEYRGK